MSVMGLVQLSTTDKVSWQHCLEPVCREHILMSVMGLVQLPTTDKVSCESGGEGECEKERALGLPLCHSPRH